ncbi:MAG: aminotransferase class V-fold PLP-dependent enzyme [Bryobacterales bacterium]|nr:aminotransferase class V-fold PLP-dependent enzyme [Bryobacterales bacterium]
MNRRAFLAGAAALSAGCGASASRELTGFEAIRADFPRSSPENVYLNNASQHPISRSTARVIQEYADYLAGELTRQPGAKASEKAVEHRDAHLKDCKELFGRLINASPREITYTLSTTMGENIVLNGMDLRGGNVVTNDLHYSACLYNYRMRQESGLDVRIARHQDWRIDMDALSRLIDRKTRLVALTLVSNVNGLLADVRKISEMAHANGAYVYADIIQGVGAVPVDVKAMGIDFAACSTYKWLMGLRGFAYLYIREDLQGSVVRPTEFGGGLSFNYPPWTANPDPAKPDFVFTPKSGGSQYEVGNVSSIAAAAQFEALSLIHRTGVPQIAAHIRTLTDRLQSELPAMGYPSITPKDNASPIVTFQLRDPKAVEDKLQRANIEVTLRFGNQMRVSPGVYNNQQDIDALLAALA